MPPRQRDVFERVRKLASLATIPVEDGEAEWMDGTKHPVLVLQHGTYRVIVDSGTMSPNTAVLLMPLPIPPENAVALAKLAGPERAKFFAIMKREMQEGRTGYILQFDPDNEALLKEIHLQQRIATFDSNAAAVQRLIDAMQEIVTIAARVVLLLASTFENMSQGTGTAPTSSSDDSMYR